MRSYLPSAGDAANPPAELNIGFSPRIIPPITQLGTKIETRGSGVPFQFSKTYTY